MRHSIRQDRHQGSGPVPRSGPPSRFVRDPPVRGEGLRHLADRGRDQRVPGSPAGHEPAGDRPLAHPPPEAVRGPDLGRQEADRRPHRPVVDPGRDREPAQKPGEWRMEDHVRQVPCRRSDPDRSSRPEHRRDVGLERGEIARQHRLRHPERQTDRSRLRIETGHPVAGQRPKPGVVGDDRRVDQRRVDPQRKSRVPRRVPVASDAPVHHVESTDLAAGRSRRAEDDPEVAPQGAVESPPRIGTEVGVLGHAGGDSRVRDLEQERARAGAEHQHRLAMRSPRFRPRSEQTRVSGAASVRAVDHFRDWLPRIHRCTITVDPGSGPWRDRRDATT